MKEKGFSLAELLVAMALFLVLLVPIMSFLNAGRAARSTSIRLTEVEHNVRAALQSIGRDIQNAGYGLAPTIPVGSSDILRLLTHTGIASPYQVTPIIPGNNLNRVDTEGATPTATSNLTDQITLLYADPTFNFGMPVSGNVGGSNSSRTFTPMTPIPAAFNTLVPGDLVVLAMGTEVAMGYVSTNTGSVINFSSGDPFNLNQPGSGPISTIAALPQQPGQVSLYKLVMITYYLDRNGNLIRRERIPPPHTNFDNLHTNVTTLSPASIDLPSQHSYTCRSTGTPPVDGTCYFDNIIATGIENLQFTYYLHVPQTGLTAGPLDDPSPRAVTPSTFPGRLLDIRQVNVSITARASEKDARLKDCFSTTTFRRGYLYRFSANATFNTRNFYGSDFRPN